MISGGLNFTSCIHLVARSLWSGSSEERVHCTLCTRCIRGTRTGCSPPCPPRLRCGSATLRLAAGGPSSSCARCRCFLAVAVLCCCCCPFAFASHAPFHFSPLALLLSFPSFVRLFRAVVALSPSSRLSPSRYMQHLGAFFYMNCYPCQSGRLCVVVVCCHLTTLLRLPRYVAHRQP